MKKFQKECLMNRIDLVRRNLRHCNSGADIHEVSNIRNVCCLIEYMVEGPNATFADINAKVCKLEAKTVDFFKRKFSYLNKDR